MKKQIAAAACLLAGGASASVDVAGKLQSVTMFRTGAELTHTAKVQLVSGTNDVVVEGLSSTADKNSIMIKCSNGVTVMSFDFSKDFVTVKEQSAAVKKMKDSLDIYTLEIEKLTAQQTTNENLLKILLTNMTNLNHEKAAPTAAEYLKLVDYYRTKSLEVSTEQITLKKEMAGRQKRVTALNNQIAQEQGRTGQPVGKLALARLAAARSVRYRGDLLHQFCALDAALRYPGKRPRQTFETYRQGEADPIDGHQLGKGETDPLDRRAKPWAYRPDHQCVVYLAGAAHADAYASGDG